MSDTQNHMFSQNNADKYLWTLDNISIYVNNKGITGKRKAFEADKKKHSECLSFSDKSSCESIVHRIEKTNGTCIAIDGIDRILGSDDTTDEQVTKLVELFHDVAGSNVSVMLLIKDDEAFDDVATIISTLYSNCGGETNNANDGTPSAQEADEETISIAEEREQINAMLETRVERTDIKTGDELTDAALETFDERADELENIIATNKDDNLGATQTMPYNIGQHVSSIKGSNPRHGYSKRGDGDRETSGVDKQENSASEHSHSQPEDKTSSETLPANDAKSCEEPTVTDVTDKYARDNYVTYNDDVSKIQRRRGTRINGGYEVKKTTPTTSNKRVMEIDHRYYSRGDQHYRSDDNGSINQTQTRFLAALVAIAFIAIACCIIALGVWLSDNSSTTYTATETSSDGNVSPIVVEATATDDDGSEVGEDTETTQGIISVLNAEHENPYHGLITLYLNVGVEFADYSGSAYTEGYILQVSAGDIINLPRVYAKDGYTFIGWSQGGIPEEPIWDMFTEQVQMTSDISDSKSTVIHALYMDDEGNGYCSCGAYAEGVYADMIDTYKANYKQYLAEAAADETQAASAEDE